MYIRTEARRSVCHIYPVPGVLPQHPKRTRPQQQQKKHRWRSQKYWSDTQKQAKMDRKDRQR